MNLWDRRFEYGGLTWLAIAGLCITLFCGLFYLRSAGDLDHEGIYLNKNQTFDFDKVDMQMESVHEKIFKDMGKLLDYFDELKLSGVWDADNEIKVKEKSGGDGSSASGDSGKDYKDFDMGKTPKTREAREMYIYKALRKLGYSKAMACAMLANSFRETGGTFLPTIVQGDVYDANDNKVRSGRGPARGIFQWEDETLYPIGYHGRWNQMSDWVKKNGKNQLELSTQVQYMDYELSTIYQHDMKMMTGMDINQFKKIPNSNQASAAFYRVALRGANMGRDLAIIQPKIDEYMKKMP